MSDRPPRYRDLREEFDQHYTARETGQPCGCLVCKAANTLGSDTMSETPQIPGVAHFPTVAASIDQPDTPAQVEVDHADTVNIVEAPAPTPVPVTVVDEPQADPPVDHAAGDQADDDDTGGAHTGRTTADADD